MAFPICWPPEQPSQEQSAGISHCPCISNRNTAHKHISVLNSRWMMRPLLTSHPPHKARARLKPSRSTKQSMALARGTNTLRQSRVHKATDLSTRLVGKLIRQSSVITLPFPREEQLTLLRGGLVLFFPLRETTTPHPFKGPDQKVPARALLPLHIPNLCEDTGLPLQSPPLVLPALLQSLCPGPSSSQHCHKIHVSLTCSPSTTGTFAPSVLSSGASRVSALLHRTKASEPLLYPYTASGLSPFKGPFPHGVWAHPFKRLFPPGVSPSLRGHFPHGAGALSPSLRGHFPQCWGSLASCPSLRREEKPAKCLGPHRAGLKQEWGLLVCLRDWITVKYPGTGEAWGVLGGEVGEREAEEWREVPWAGWGVQRKH